MNETLYPDQVEFKVTPNLDSFHRFHETFAHILTEFNHEFDLLSFQIVENFEATMQEEREFKRKMELCRVLKRRIQKHNPKWKFNVVPTGSSVTGLATENSDLDIAIHIPQAALIIEDQCHGKEVSKNEKMFMQKKMNLDILQIVRLILEKDEEINEYIDWNEGLELRQAQIPILKLTTSDRIECDISVFMECFLSSMHNSYMIKQFAEIDIRFRHLCAVVKDWGAITKVKNSRDGGFNSYALVLLVIHFLQCGTSPPILPNMIKMYQGYNFIAQSDVDYPTKLDFGAPLPFPPPLISQNPATVSQLFLEFLHYYMDFDFKMFYISINHAMIKNRQNCPREQVNVQRSKEVYIEDPFDAHNPGRTVRTLKKIQSVMRETLNMFNPQASVEENSRSPGREFKFPTLEDLMNIEVYSPRIEEEDENQGEAAGDIDNDEEEENFKHDVADNQQ